MIAFFKKNGYDILLLNLLLFFLTIFSISPGYAKGLDSLKHRIRQTRQRLQAIEQKIRKNEQKINTIRRGEEKILKKIEICDQFIEKYKYKRRTLDDKISMNKLKQARLAREIAQMEGVLADKKNSLALRTRSLYKAGPLRFWRVLVSGSVAEVFQKITYMKLIAEEDSRSIQKFSQQLKKLRVKKETICSYQKDAEEIQKKIIEQGKNWSKKKREKKNYLYILRKKEKECCLAKDVLSHSLNEIQTLLNGWQNRGGKLLSADFLAHRGELSWPVQGKLVSSGALSKTKGLTIKSPAGRGIYSIYAGKVAYADWCIRYGKLLIVDHGGGYCSIYAHLSELLVGSGDFVRERQLMARVGDTGAVSEPQLYFEIRYQGHPVNPLKWLKRR